MGNTEKAFELLKEFEEKVGDPNNYLYHSDIYGFIDKLRHLLYNIKKELKDKE